ncbi:MAG: hypothetical protein KA371_12265 [Acidobacteria bacterium]|nr:hypothetical protein [Acidobacteriota bacterium]
MSAPSAGDGDFAHVLEPLDRKRRHFASYAISASRDAGGKARRQPKVS